MSFQLPVYHAPDLSHLTGAPDARYELLNFNPLCRSKYQSLGQSYPVGGHAFSAQEMDAFYEIVRRAGVRHIVKE